MFHWLRHFSVNQIVADFIMNRSMNLKIPQLGGKIDEDFSHFSECIWKLYGNLYDSGSFQDTRKHDATNTGMYHAFPIDAFSQHLEKRSQTSSSPTMSMRYSSGFNGKSFKFFHLRF